MRVTWEGKSSFKQGGTKKSCREAVLAWSATCLFLEVESQENMVGGTTYPLEAMTLCACYFFHMVVVKIL